MKRLIFVLLLILLFPSVGIAAYYWVDDTGTETVNTNCDTVDATPPAGSTSGYCSPTTGLADINTHIAAGDTVYFRGGTYNIASGSIINPAASGTSGSRITYASYADEQVNFVGTANDYSITGISIVGKDWIKVTGYDGSTAARKMKFSNMAHFLRIWDGQSGSEGDSAPGTGGNYNEISYCEFTETTSGWIAGNYAADSSRVMHNSTYNWIHHNTFSKSGGYTTTNDISALLNLGWEDCGYYASNTCIDETHDNVIEDNIMYHGGHQVIGIFNYNNVVRNNVFHNEQWYLGTDDARHSYRVIQTQASYNTDYHHSYNLIEGNRISHASENMIPSNQGGTGIHLSSSYNVIRYNDFYANAGNAVYVEVHDKTYGRTNYNHIYNNTFFANGHGATFPTAGPPGRTSPPDRSTFYFGASEAQFPTIQYGNVVKNNLSWRDYTTSQANYWTVRAYDATDGWRNMTEALCTGAICGDTVIASNWLPADGDPKFTNEGSYSSPSVLTQNYEWYWTTPDGSDLTTINTEPVFTLQSSSPAIDGGTSLTTAHGAGEATATLVVHDAGYFQPGWGKWASGGPSVVADTICVGTVSNCSLIVSIVYATNTITLTDALTWADDASVWLQKKSDGVQVLFGNAPDYGAHEYAGAGSSGTIKTGSGGKAGTGGQGRIKTGP